ncbi:hypothetical protein GYMLUDRAFT_192613 [Collybiopsis luxurians FD-317 M1]|nr:hypothetical protein GYMLUDRAFT_192613 [Collybiopsis luxurians FD-317 M1]
MEIIAGTGFEDLATALVSKPLWESHDLLNDILIRLRKGIQLLDVNFGSLNLKTVEDPFGHLQNFRAYFTNIQLYTPGNSMAISTTVGIPFLRFINSAISQSPSRDFARMLLQSDELGLLNFINTTGMNSVSQSLFLSFLERLGPLDNYVDQMRKSVESGSFLMQQTTGSLHEQLRLSFEEENMRIFASIIAEHADKGASPLSKFIDGQLPPLNASERPYMECKKTPIEVFNGDTSVVARQLMDSAGEDAKGRTAVFSLASNKHPGGGWQTGISASQEISLCHFSTLVHTLTQPDTISHYPWPNTGPGSVVGIFSEGVVIFREPLNMKKDKGFLDLLEDSSQGYYNSRFAPFLPLASRKVMSVISVASPRYPRCSPDGSDFAEQGVKEELKEKVRLVLRIAGMHGKRYLVLGAMGCGGHFCPPASVARLMKSVLMEKEFEGWFAKIVFAILDSDRRGHRNFEIFKNVLAGVEM